MIGSAVQLGSVRTAGLLLGMVMNVLLARLLGPSGFGELAFLLSLVTLLAAISSGGLSSLLTREVASSPGCPIPLGSSLRWVLLSTSSFATVVFGVVSMGWTTFSFPTTDIFLALVGLGIVAITSGILRGAGRPVAADLPISVLIPAGFSLIVVAMSSRGTLEFTQAFAGYTTAVWIAAVIAIAVLLIRGEFVRRGVASGPISRNWLASFAPFSFLALIAALNGQLGTVMVGIFAAEADTAFFRVADRVAALVSMPLVVLNAVIAADIARGYASGDVGAVLDLVRRARRWAILGATPLILGMVIFGRELVQFLFGSQYAAGSYLTLVILVAGQAVNVVCGSVGLALTMCAREKFVLREQAVAMGMAAIALPPVILFAGITGAAAVVSVVLAAWNLRLLAILNREFATTPAAS